MDLRPNLTVQNSYWQGGLKRKMLLYPEYEAVNGANDASEKI